MDPTDKKLLMLLQRDASKTNAEMAQEVSLSPSSCLRRIRRLHRSGIIDRIVAILNPAKAGRVLKVIVTVELKARDEQNIRRFLQGASAEEAVTRAYSITGGADIILFLHLRDMSEYERLCNRLFGEKTNVSRFVGMVVIRTAKEETAIAI
ncbi:AsnC family transcriptional regulator [Agrobacterium vitis]|uniref:AsnC family transcriptional regulator n=1 Tax=Agrobacterium vitis TaxID=373 RepID=A0A6L6VHJ8_AGRVI|nr:Lrp/AsnC family transcriptional regulator [Agrobacterium vitis]MUZ74491.1 AsnC family transcriptional regulator [Agrobacterium vitis]